MLTRKKPLFYLFMVLLTILACFAFMIGFFALRAYTNPFARSDARIEGDIPTRKDVDIGYVAAPHSSTLITDVGSGLKYHQYTDRRGARVNGPDDEVPAAVDILTIGGSFAWGHGVENPDTFTAIVGRTLQAPVANLSMRGYGTVQSLQVLRRNLDLRPKVIVYGFIDDHIRRNLSPCAPSQTSFCTPVSFIDFDEKDTPFIHAPLSEYFSFDEYDDVLSQDRFTLRDVFWRMKMDLLRLKERENIAYRNDTMVRHLSLRFLMEELAETAKSVGARLIIVHIPYLKDAAGINPPPNELLYAIRETDATLVDLSPVIASYYEGNSPSLTNNQYDFHPNRTAHRIIARELVRHLRRGTVRPEASN